MDAYMRVLGVDPGKDVALCLLSEDAAPVIRKIVSPGKGVSEESLHAALVELRPDVAYVELVGVMPGQGASSGATFMVAWGIIRGMLRGVGIRYELVSPIKWKNSVLVGCDMGPPLPKEVVPDGLTRQEKNAWRKDFRKHRMSVAADRKKVQKEAAVRFISTRYPEINLVPPRCRVADHNLAEAVCLAHYGQEAERAR